MRPFSSAVQKSRCVRPAAVLLIIFLENMKLMLGSSSRSRRKVSRSVHVCTIETRHVLLRDSALMGGCQSGRLVTESAGSVTRAHPAGVGSHGLPAAAALVPRDLALHRLLADVATAAAATATTAAAATATAFAAATAAPLTAAVPPAAPLPTAAAPAAAAVVYRVPIAAHCKSDALDPHQRQARLNNAAQQRTAGRPARRGAPPRPACSPRR